MEAFWTRYRFCAEAINFERLVSSMAMRTKGPKCKLCGKGISIMSYDAAYLKVVKPGEAKAGFVCWGCAKKLLGEKLEEF